MKTKGEIVQGGRVEDGRKGRKGRKVERPEAGLPASHLPAFRPSYLLTFGFPAFLPSHLRPSCLPTFLPCFRLSSASLPPFSLLLSSAVRLARRYLISGRVQGVGYRYFAEAVAAREGIHGWVQNLPGGNVEAVAEGDADAIERFERAIRHGPSGARIDHVDVESTVPSGRDTGFAVR